MNQMSEALLTAIRRSPNVSALDEFTAEYRAFKDENSIRAPLPVAMKQKAANLIKGGIKRSQLAEKLGISQSAIIAWQKDVEGTSATVRKARTGATGNGKPIPTPIQLAGSTSDETYSVEIEGVKLSGPKSKVRALINKVLS
jgi:hypothetical protein